MPAEGGGASEPGAGADGGEGELKEGPERRRHSGPHHRTQSRLDRAPGQALNSRNSVLSHGALWQRRDVLFCVFCGIFVIRQIIAFPLCRSPRRCCDGRRSPLRSPAATPATPSPVRCPSTAPRCSAGSRLDRGPRPSGDMSSGKQRSEVKQCVQHSKTTRSGASGKRDAVRVSDFRELVIPNWIEK